MIGASGAIAGYLVPVYIIFPQKYSFLYFFIFFTIRVPASILLIFWFVFQFLNLSNSDSSVAWTAHIGGFIFGYIFSVINGKAPSKERKFDFFKEKKRSLGLNQFEIP